MALATIQYGNGITFTRDTSDSYSGIINYNIIVDGNLNYQVLNGDDNHNSWLIDTITIPTYARWDTVLHLKVSSESRYDYLRIISSGTTTPTINTPAIDETTLERECSATSVESTLPNSSLEISGNESGTVTIRDTGGATITIKILYRKDSSASSGMDSGYWAVTYTNTSSSSDSIGFIRDSGITSITHNGNEVSGYGADNPYPFTLGDSFLINSSSGIIRIEHNGSLVVERQADAYVFQPLEGGTYLINGSTGEGTITGRQLAFSTNWDVYETEFNDGIIPDVYFTITNNVDDNALTYYHEDIISIGDEFAEIIPTNTTELYISTDSLSGVTDYGIAGIEVNGNPVRLGDYSGGNLTGFPVTVSPSGNVTLRINFGPLEGQVGQTTYKVVNGTSTTGWSLTNIDFDRAYDVTGDVTIQLSSGVSSFSYSINSGTSRTIPSNSTTIPESSFTSDIENTITITSVTLSPTRYRVVNQTSNSAWSIQGVAFNSYYNIDSNLFTLTLSNNVTAFTYRINYGAAVNITGNQVNLYRGSFNANSDNTIYITSVTVSVSDRVTVTINQFTTYYGDASAITIEQGNNVLGGIDTPLNFNPNQDLIIRTPYYTIQGYGVNGTSVSLYSAPISDDDFLTIPASSFTSGDNTVRLDGFSTNSLEIVCAFYVISGTEQLSGTFKVLPLITSNSKVIIKNVSTSGEFYNKITIPEHSAIGDTSLYNFIAWKPGVTYRCGKAASFEGLTWSAFLDHEASMEFADVYEVSMVKTNRYTKKYTINFYLDYINPDRGSNGFEQNKLLTMSEIAAYCYGLDIADLPTWFDAYSQYGTDGQYEYCPSVGFVREWLPSSLTSEHPFTNINHDWLYDIYSSSIDGNACRPIKVGSTTYINSNPFFTNQTNTITGY